MLEHHADAERAGGLGRVERHRPALPQDLAFGRLQQTIEHLDEGGFPGAVFAQQSVIFTGPDVEIDLLVGLDRPEALRQAADRHEGARQSDRG